MLQDVYQPIGIHPGQRAAVRAGVVGNMPELQFPGAVSWPMEMGPNDRPDWQPVKITNGEAKRIARGVLAQALRDARRRCPEQSDARLWLAGGEDLAFWLELAELRITRADLDQFLERTKSCPKI